MAVKAPVLNFVDIPVTPSHYYISMQVGSSPR